MRLAGHLKRGEHLAGLHPLYYSTDDGSTVLYSDRALCTATNSSNLQISTNLGDGKPLILEPSHDGDDGLVLWGVVAPSDRMSLDRRSVKNATLVQVERYGSVCMLLSSASAAPSVRFTYRNQVFTATLIGGSLVTEFTLTE